MRKASAGYLMVKRRLRESMRAARPSVIRATASVLQAALTLLLLELQIMCLCSAKFMELHRCSARNQLIEGGVTWICKDTFCRSPR